MKRIAALLAWLLLACGSPHAQLIQSKQITPQSVVNTGNYATHAALLTALTGFTVDTLTQAGFGSSGDGGAATYTWSANSYCPGGTLGSPVATDDIVCIFPGQAAPYTSSTAGRYLLQNNQQIDVRSVGMAPGGQDNSPFVAALMKAMGAISAAAPSGYDVVFPQVVGQTWTTYYFSQPLELTRGARYHCSGTQGNSPSVVLLFPAGVNGVIQASGTYSSDGGSGNGTIDGCYIYSNDFTYNGVGAAGSATITGGTLLGDPGNVLPVPTVGIGDAIIVGTLSAITPPGATPVVATGATISNVSGGTLTLSSPYTLSSQLGAAEQVFTESPIAIGTNPSIGDAFVIGNNTYTIASPIGATPGNVLRGATWQATMTNLANCINTNVTSSTCVASVSTPNVTAEVPTAYFTVFWALTGGTGGNSLTSTYTPAGTSAGSFAAATFGSGAGITPGRATLPLGLFDLPVAQAFTVQTTNGTKVITVTAGPRLIRPGDYLYSDAFPLFTSVTTASGTVGNQTLGVQYNATVTHTVGSPGQLWVIPAQIKREVTAGSSNNSGFGWGWGLNMTCSTASSLNCTTSKDQNNFVSHSLVARLVSGNNTGASTSVADEGADNYVSDVIENGAVGSHYTAYNSNSMEDSSSRWPVIVNCANQNTSMFSGGYWGGGGWGLCAGTNVIPSVVSSSQSLIIGPQAAIPAGTPIIESGQIYGLWLFSSGPDNLYCMRMGSNSASTALFGFSNAACTTGSLYAWGWDTTLNAWELTGPAGIVQTYTSPNTNFTGVTNALQSSTGAPAGLYLDSAEDGTNWPGSQRMLEYGQESGGAGFATWHQWGDIRFNSQPALGGSSGVIDTPLFQTTLTAAVTKAVTTSVTITACPTITPPVGTPITDNLFGHTPVLLGTFASCTTGTLTFQAAASNSSFGTTDPIRFLQFIPFGPVSNSATVPDYTAQAIRSGSSSNTDLTGRITLSGGTATYNLTETYTSAPNCLTADVTTPANASSVSESTTVLTFTGTGTDVIKYQCNGRN
jgi:hypothetical protein